jgi:hypothetical protein
MTSRLLPLLFCALLSLGAAEQPATSSITLGPGEALKQGRVLINEILAGRPEHNATNTGVLRIREAKSKYSEIPVRFEIVAGETNWETLYQTIPGTNASRSVTLQIIHAPGKPNEYHLTEDREKTFSGNDAAIPFAGSDFWVADLGLEFFHWPEQRLIKKEMRRSQWCNVQESINPAPKPGGYSRVVSWIDADSNGIIYAEAYDAKGKLLKIFEPTEFKKVDGEWQLQEMEIRNAQTGSRTKIEFHLGSK